MGGRVRTGLFAALTASVMMACCVAGCTNGSCTENQSSLPLAGFYNSATKGTVSLDSLEIHGIGAPGDSMLYTPGTPLTEIYLPFRNGSHSTGFCISYRYRELDNPALNDTLTFGYDSSPYFAGEECGAMFRYRLKSLSHTTHLIDSITVVDSLITNKPIQQLHIFFKVTDADEGSDQ